MVLLACADHKLTSLVSNLTCKPPASLHPYWKQNIHVRLQSNTNTDYWIHKCFSAHKMEQVGLDNRRCLHSQLILRQTYKHKQATSHTNSICKANTQKSAKFFFQTISPAIFISKSTFESKQSHQDVSCNYQL